MQSAPPLAVWLITRFASRRHREALLGDLSEQLAAGKGRGWYWRQTCAALFVARWTASRPLIAALKAALLALGLIVMGAGTLSWAETLKQDCHSATCPR